MYKTINFNEFCDSFSDTYKNNFSYEGKKALFDYLENYEKETGEDVELDIVALCCDYTEYDNILDIVKNYSNSFTDNSENISKEQAITELENLTQVIRVEDTDSIIIQNY